MENNLETLFAADPQLAEAVKARLLEKEALVDEQTVEVLVAESIRSLCQEISFGRSVGLGMAELAGRVSPEYLLEYRDIVRQAAREGPTLGRIMATHLVAVFLHGSRSLLDQFMAVTRIMRAKGTYTLNRPLAALTALLKAGDQKSARAYLALMAVVFSQQLNYNQCLRFASLLPEAVAVFDKKKRVWQLEQLQRVIRSDHQLAQALMEGMQKGLQRLDRPALQDFVRLGLEKYQQDSGRGSKFLSLDSKTGRDTCRRMQICVGLDEVQSRLNRYLTARTGMPLAVRPASALPQTIAPELELKSDPEVCSDGRFVYLPDEIDIFGQRSENLFFYLALTRLEAAFYEFATFDFDLEKALEQCCAASPTRASEALSQKCAEWLEKLHREGYARADDKGSCDLQRFFSLFPLPALAADLLAIFELARLRVLLKRRYPGLVQRVMPLLEQEARRLFEHRRPGHPLGALYLRLALGVDSPDVRQSGARRGAFVEKVVVLWQAASGQELTVETGARIVFQTYCEAAARVGGRGDCLGADNCYRSFPVPFGWRPRPELFRSAQPEIDRLAARLKTLLARQGLTIYRSDLKLRLQQQNGHLTARDIQQLAGSALPPALDLEQLLNDGGWRSATDLYEDAGDNPVFWYREWDCRLADYLQNHVRVVERPVQGPGNDFFRQVLQRHRGLIQRMRYAFEMLKPRGLMILRQWPDGDEFDYRALLDYALDRRAGLLPSERLYIKRVKQRRDVAVLLLVDLSRSTANRVPGSGATVLEVEKEAIVILTQALEVLGDTFAIAGFSGNGRLGVDYFRLKDFDESMDEAVRRRIGAVRAQRNTRMGAAVRHAAVALERVPARVRLLIVLSDGFPNDLDYKRQYAVQDTRRALFELQAKSIYIHAITVNQAADPELDDLYGHIHHSLISDVRQLPDKLVWIYGRLTRT